MARTGSRSTVARDLRSAIAVGYCRRSTDRQEQSIPDQQRAVEQYCLEHKLQLDRFYIDDAISGTSTAGRHGFQKMMSDAQRHEGSDFGVIVVYDVKRFGRVDNDEAGYYRHVLRNHGVEVRYVSENFQGDGTDDLLRPVKQWQARQESKDLSKVVIRGLLSKSQTGHWMGGAPPYGFDLKYQSQAGELLFYLRYNSDGTKLMFDKNWKVVRTLQRGETVAVSKKDHCTLVHSDPARLKTIRRVFSAYINDGMGFKAIAEEFNRRKVPTCRGPLWAHTYSGQWAMTTIRAILINPAYCGDMVWNRHTDARFHKISEGVAIERKNANARRLEVNPESDWLLVPNAHPAIVSRRTWEMVKQRLASLSTSAEQRGVDQRQGVLVSNREFRTVGALTGPRARFLLSKLVTCGKCGSRYEGYTHRRTAANPDGTYTKTYHYACGGYIRRGKSVCELGKIRQEVLETGVIEAVLKYYQRYEGANGEKLLAEEIRKAVGADDDELQGAEAKFRTKLGEVESTIRRLLDNITPATRSAVERRLKELEAEKKTVKGKVESIAHLAFTKTAVRELVRETRVFLGGLRAALTGGPLERRQVALRRCAERVTIEAGRQAAGVFTFRAPLLSARTGVVQMEIPTH